eukprot:3935010-Rhodomonas_salina.4
MHTPAISCHCVLDTAQRLRGQTQHDLRSTVGWRRTPAGATSGSSRLSQNISSQQYIAEHSSSGKEVTYVLLTVQIEARTASTT